MSNCGLVQLSRTSQKRDPPGDSHHQQQHERRPHVSHRVTRAAVLVDASTRLLAREVDFDRGLASNIAILIDRREVRRTKTPLGCVEGARISGSG